MKSFAFHRPVSLEAAARKLGDAEGAVIKAGGIDLMDRLKERTAEPDHLVALVDVDGAARQIAVEGGVLRIGALVTLADLDASEDVRRHAPSLAHAAGEAASPQIRNLATVAGNLAQRTRCHYYRLRSFPCFRRGASACSTRKDGAVQDMAGIFGNDPCASSHPSSLAPVLCALDATLHYVDADGKPGSAPLRTLWHEERVRGREEDLSLPADAVITHVLVPTQDVGRGEVDAYEEIRQRGAFDWALVSCAVRLRREGDKVAEASIWLGAAAPVPWCAAASEAALSNEPFGEASVKAAVEAATEGATPLEGTAYKVPLVRAAVRRALEQAWGRS